MAQFQITSDSEIVQGIFQRDDGLSTVVEQVLNQILKAQVAGLFPAGMPSSPSSILRSPCG